MSQNKFEGNSALKKKLLPSTVLTKISFIADELALEIVRTSRPALSSCSVDLMPFAKVIYCMTLAGVTTSAILVWILL